MKQFSYVRVTSGKAAISELSKDKTAMFLAGGTNLVDLMKSGVTNPERLVDITRVPLATIEATKTGLRIGALAKNTAVAEHPLVLKHFPLLSQALNAGASPQLRNMATVGGNMMQRTRCHYFYDTALPCNKRNPGSGCGAIGGFSRMHAIFGASDKCIAVHPSDMCVALTALDAVITVTGAKGERKISFGEFHRLPGDTPEIDNTLQRGELITAVDIPFNDALQQTHYLKVRDRASYAFALVSAGVALSLKGNNIADVRIAMGGVAHKPWRLKEAEAYLKGKPATEEHFREAARLTMAQAKAEEGNAYKLTLAPNTIVEALKLAAANGNI
ncbi:FAD binding domain-containing protein [Chitinophaga rhizophila]|uniref:Xanthine dehydrogenase family protein subunit M n=1 Tax=Chitinophaga rhizophila TaxID=2866212 RepID=A0ABS7G938_9BACT|nr:xanthine dehydrogenase family protein subunit M [Chitinophaga rhizophila]MBW8683820.1 xanthine dehydrogenase family protein subunit M [Chitinophaga rhizophila]